MESHVSGMQYTAIHSYNFVSAGLYMGVQMSECVT